VLHADDDRRTVPHLHQRAPNDGVLGGVKGALEGVALREDLKAVAARQVEPHALVVQQDVLPHLRA
jgi:hypothetical protein